MKSNWIISSLRGNVYVELICTEEPREIATGYKMIPAPKVSDYKKESL